MTILSDEAKEILGTTENPKEAGYILPDGTMTKMGEAHYVDAAKVLDVRLPYPPEDENEVEEYEYEINDIVDKFLKDSGAIRLKNNKGNVFFDLMTKPTNSQLKVIKDFYSETNPDKLHFQGENLVTNPIKRALRVTFVR